MFVPGVNGSIIANFNAPSGSRLKGAYKNSKKRKAEDGMVSQKPKPNGGSVDIVSTLKQLDPNFNKPKNTVNPVIKEALSSADKATDMLQLGHFSTLPWAQGAALVGDIAGIGVDLAQSGIANYEGNNLNAVGNLAMASAPAIVGSRGYTRSRSMVNNAAPGRYRPTSALTPAHAANPVIAKGLAWNKAALAANVAEMASNIDSRTYATQRVPQRDNTQVIMRPNPNRPIMINGGRQPITNVSSQGDFDYSVSKRVGNFTGNLQGSVNAPSMSSNYAKPKLAYNRKALSSYVTPGGFGAGLQGNKAYVNYDQSKQGMDMYRSGAAGYNTDKVNVNANANFRNNLLENAGVGGSYNINPNLSVVGNYNVSQGESGLNPNYFAGFKFNKTFKEGGETDHDDDKEMVDGVASILRRVKDPKNRLQLANQLSKQFNRENVKYDLPSFLAKSKVKK